MKRQTQCPKCGTKNPEDVSHCLYCGGELAASPEAARPAGRTLRIGAKDGAAALLLGLVGVPLSMYILRNPGIQARDELAPLLFLPVLFPVAVLMLGLFRGVQAAQCRRSRIWKAGQIVAALVLYGCVSLIVIGVSLDPTVAYAKLSARNDVCRHGIERLAQALLMYAADYDDTLPPASQWCEAARSYDARSDSDLRCPMAVGRPWPQEQPRPWSDYAYNAALSGRRLAGLRGPGRLVLVFESDEGWNAAGGPELLPAEPRHFGGDNYGCADGRERWVSREKMMPWEAGVTWEP